MLKVRSLACAALLLLIAPAAFAHARVVRSTPAKSAALAKPPEQIELWFNELLDAGFNTIEVIASADIGRSKPTNLATEKPVVDARDRTHLILKMKPLAPGEYAVQWRVLSRDGHSAPGRFTFRILPH